MKKLLFAVTTDLNHDQRMQRICGSLAAQGYAVELVGRQKPNSQPLLPQPYAQHRIRCRVNSGKLFYLEYMLRLSLFLRKRRYDAYCAIDLDTALPVYFGAQRVGGAFVYDAHEYFPEVVEVTDRKLVKAVWAAIERFVVTRTQHAYTVTQSIADIFWEKYKVKFEVIRNMPPLVPYAAPEKQRGTILYQGAVNAGRGLEELLQAMVAVEGKLVVCGEGDVLPQLKEQAKALGIAHRVDFRGQLLPQDLLQVTRSCGVGIMLLQNKGLSYYFSLANKFFDYVHAGVPQLIIDFPEYRQLNEQYRVGLLTGLNVREIADNLQRLLHDQELYERLAANCLVARQALNWQQEEPKLWQFYERLWQK